MKTETLKYISTMEASAKFKVTEEELSEAITNSKDETVLYQRKMRDGSGGVVGWMQLTKVNDIFEELELLRLDFAQ
tara:strand:+ start:417 stop:644 length:228 start_codon:yes stop_codon:yes gene_type:complete